MFPPFNIWTTYDYILHEKSIHFACGPTKPSSKQPVSGTAAFASVEAALQPERTWPWPPRYHRGSNVPQPPAAALVHLGLKRRLSGMPLQKCTDSHQSHNHKVKAQNVSNLLKKHLDDEPASETILVLSSEQCFFQLFAARPRGFKCCAAHIHTAPGKRCDTPINPKMFSMQS